MLKTFRWVRGLALGLALGSAASPALAQTSASQSLLEGVVYDSRTRAPISGARMWLENIEAPGGAMRVPALCYTLDVAGSFSDDGVFTTGANGRYVFSIDRINPPYDPEFAAAYPACRGDQATPLQFRLVVEHPDYAVSTLEPAQGGSVSRAAAEGELWVSPGAGAPTDWPRAQYWLSWSDGKLAPRIINHHIPLDDRDPDYAELRATVVDAVSGAPIPGARLTLTGPEGAVDPVCLAAGSASAVSDAGGGYFYRIDVGAHRSCPAGGRFSVAALPPAGSTEYRTGDQGETVLGFGGRAAIPLEMTPPARLSGVVTDSVTGAPIPGAVVTIVGPNGPLNALCLLEGTSPQNTTATGGYALRIALGAHASCPATGGSFSASVAPPAGYESPASGNTPLAPGGNGTIPLSLTPIPAPIEPARLSGVVTDSVTGAPIPGAVVTIVGPNGPLNAACFLEGVSPQNTTATGAYAVRIALGAHASCPATGGSFSASVAPPAGYQAAASGNTPLAPGGNGTIPLSLTPIPAPIEPARLSGVVTDSVTGAPIPGAVVTIVGPSGPLNALCFLDGTSSPQNTTATGGYAVRIALGAHASCPATGGSFAASVAPPAGYQAAASGNTPLVPGGNGTIPLSLTPIPAPIEPARLSGVVTDSVTGAPIPGAVVTIVGPSGPLNAACFLEGVSPQNTTATGGYAVRIALGAHASCPATGGSFAASVAPPAGYQAAASGNTPLAPGATGTIPLSLTPIPSGPARIIFAGVVSHPNGGAPIPGALVTLHGPSGPMNAACFIEGASPQAAGNPRGDYRMVVEFGRHATCPPSGQYTAHVEPPEGYVGTPLSIGSQVIPLGDLRDVNINLELALLDLRIGKGARSASAAAGEVVWYEVTLHNNGRATESVAVEDRFSPWLTYVEGSSGLRGSEDEEAEPIAPASTQGRLLGFGPFDLAPNQTLRISYALRVSHAAPAATAENVATILRRDVQGRYLPVRSASARVAISASSAFDDSVVFGKVYYDCNANGWQDQPFASRLMLSGGFAPGALIPGGVTVDRGFGPEPVAGDLAFGMALGDLAPAQVGAGPGAGKIVVRARLARPELPALRLVTAEGFDATLAPDGQWLRAPQPRGFAGCGDLRMMRALTPAPDGSHIMTVVIASGCRAESGVAGARLATVEGLIIETDSYGRYHIADGRSTDWRRGSNMLVKLDESSLPMGARVLSANPQRLRLTGGPMQAADFAVSCPAPQGFYAEQIAEIGAVCFLPGTASIDPLQKGALVAAAEHLLVQGGGEVVVECRPCEGVTDAALNAGRVAAVHAALAGMLPVEIMSRVTVRSEASKLPLSHPAGFSPMPAGGPAFAPLPIPQPHQPEPAPGFFQRIFGSDAGGAGPLRALALAGALLGAEEARADAPGAGKAVSAPLVRGVIETPRPQFVGPMAPAPFCPTLGRPLRPGEACPTPQPLVVAPPIPAPTPVVTGIYCPDTRQSLPLGATCPKPQAAVVATPVVVAPVLPVEPPKPAFAVKPRELCPESKCADLTVRSLVELPFGASLTANADAMSADPRLDAIAPSAALLAAGGLAEPLLFRSFSNYPTFIDHWEVAIFREADRHLARPVALLKGARLGDPVLWNGAAADGRGFKPGETLHYVVRAYDSEGRRDETKPRKLLLTADPEHFALKGGPRSAYGRDSLARQSIPLIGGRVTLRGSHVPPGWLVAVSGEEIPVDEKGEFVWESLRRPGSYEIPVELAAPDGVVWNRVVGAHVPADSFFMVGLADLTIGQDYVSNALEAIGGADEFDKDIFANGRLAFYLKGKIQGRYLITAQADTHENEIEHIFDDFVDYRNPRHMFRRLDPDRYYPVYGDGSIARSDVDTQGKFYVRVEDGDSSLMWGNANTGFTGTELARYERSLYGARGEFNSRSATSYGESNLHVKGFASQPHTAAAHNEFLGTGGSLYYLRQRDIVTGSEKLRVEIRDRDSGRVLESVALIPGKDYEINFIQGRVMLAKPLRGFAGLSGTNVVSSGPLGEDVAILVADYEYVPDVGDGEDWTYGGRAMAWLGDHLRIGGTYVEENQETGGAYELMGADAALRWRPGTYLRAEWARSEASETADVRFSNDGGLTFEDLAPVDRPRKGDAWSVEARVNLEEVLNGGWGGEIQGWWRERDAGYSNVQASLDGFRRSFGGSVDLRPTETLRLALRAHEGEYEGGDKERVIAGQVDQEFGRVGLSVEARYEEELNRGGPDASGLILGGRLSYQVLDGAKVYVRGQTSVMEEGDFVDATGGAVGFSAQISDRLTGHAEYAHYVDRGAGATVGLEYRRSPDHVVYGAYTHSTDRDDERRHAFTLGQRANVASGLDVYHENLYGVRRDGAFEASQIYGAEIRPLDDLTLGLSYQRSDLDAQEGDLERDAISASARWKTARLELSGKAEYRRDRGGEESTDQWLGTARAKFEATPSTTLLAKASISETEDRRGSTRDARFWEASVGLAYRPVDNDRLNLLAKYTYLYDLPAPEQVSGDTDQRAHLVSAEGSYRVTPGLTFGAKGAYKHGEVRADRDAGGWSRTRLSYGAVHTRLKIFDNWDALAEYRALYDLESEAVRHGTMLAVYRRFGDNFELGAGYNFAAFGDDLFDLDANGHGWFVNAVGKF